MPQGGINNFIDAANKLAGKPHGKHRGYVFSNAWVYNTIESICVALMVDPQGDREIIAGPAGHAGDAGRLDSQDPGRPGAGRIHPDVLHARRSSSAGRPGTEAITRDTSPATSSRRPIAHYLLTNKTDARLYDAAKRLADCWCDNLGPPPKKPWYDGHQAMEIALVRFGRFVNEMEGEGKGDKYIELAKFLLDNRKDGHEYDQSHVPVVQQYEAVGHAVRAVYSYAGMADVAMETGDVDYQSAVMSLWDNIVNRKYYVTGGVGSGETSEGFGPDYSLRHNAYCESCSSCGEIFFQHKLHLTYHDAKYADLYEETLYNALLGSIDLEGKNFYYQNPLDSNRPRYDWHGCPCCVGNIPRTLLMLPTWTYSKSADSIYVNLFIGSTVTVEDVAGTDVEMVQTTDYPWSGEVSHHRQSRGDKGIQRQDSRSQSQRQRALYQHAAVRRHHVDCAQRFRDHTPIENGYAVITRTWKAGDKIDLVLPMKIQRSQGHRQDRGDSRAGCLAMRPIDLLCGKRRSGSDKSAKSRFHTEHSLAK